MFWSIWDLFRCSEMLHHWFQSLCTLIGVRCRQCELRHSLWVSYCGNFGSVHMPCMPDILRPHKWHLKNLRASISCSIAGIQLTRKWTWSWQRVINCYTLYLYSMNRQVFARGSSSIQHAHTTMKVADGCSWWAWHSLLPSVRTQCRLLAFFCCSTQS